MSLVHILASGADHRKLERQRHLVEQNRCHHSTVGSTINDDCLSCKRRSERRTDVKKGGGTDEGTVTRTDRLRDSSRSEAADY